MVTESDLNSIKVLDGGFGFQAIKRSSLEIEGHKLWSCRLLLEDPDQVVSIHREFLSAGAEVIETNTYQANVDTFVAASPDTMTPSLAGETLASGVKLARRAVDEEAAAAASGSKRRVLIAGSCGPYGAAMCDLSEYTGAYCDTMTEEDLINWHRPRVAALAAAGADLIAFDTIPALTEARALARLSREFPNCPAWLSFVSQDGRATCRGDLLGDCAKDPVIAGALSASTLCGLGVNCIVTSRNVAKAAECMAAAGGALTIAYPDLGGYLGSPTEPITEELVTDWLRLGVRWIGGCCGAGPAEVARVARAVSRFRSDSADGGGLAAGDGSVR